MLDNILTAMPSFIAKVEQGMSILIADGGLRVNTSLFPVGEFVPVTFHFDREIKLEERTSRSNSPLMKASDGGTKTVINGAAFLSVNGTTVETPLSGSQIMGLCLLQKSRTANGRTIGDMWAKSRTVVSQGRELVVLDIHCEEKADKNRPFVVKNDGSPAVLRYNSVDTPLAALGVNVANTQQTTNVGP
jgi:hypothetical protein